MPDATPRYTTMPQSLASKSLGGGLNTTSGPLHLEDSESSDLSNIDFDKFGSILKRGGYTAVSTSPVWAISTLLVDGGFETWTSSSVLTNWLYTQTGTGGSLAQEATVIHDGIYSALISPSSTGQSVLYPATTYISATAGVTYTVAAYVKSANTVSAQVQVSLGFFDNTNTLIGSSHVTSYQNSGDWEIVSVTQTAPAGTVEFKPRFLVLSGANAPAYYDTAAAYTVPATTGQKSDGMYWYEYDASGTTTRLLINVVGGIIYTMPETMSGTWTDKTGTAGATAGNFHDFETYRGRCFGTNGVNTPWMKTGAGNAQPIPALLANSYTFGVNSITTNPAVGDTYTNNGVTYTISYVNTSGTAGAIGGYIVATGSGAAATSGNLTRTAGAGDATIAFTITNANVNITKAKYVSQYNNYLFLACVTTGDGIYHPTRIYWCDINNPESWSGTSWIEVSYLDGQEITRMWGFSNYLFIFKTRSIYGLTFTGDADFPFILPGGGRSSSSVGCIAPWSMSQIEEGVIFLSYDGVYLFDGSTSYKISDKIRDLILGYNTSNYSKVVTTINRKKNMIYMAFPTGTTNDVVLIFNFFLKCWSRYAGMAPSAMCTAYVNGKDERPLFADYSGFVYRMDTGLNDYPLNAAQAISAYWYSNWKTFDELISKKGIPEVTVYYGLSNGTMTFSYSYDFNAADQFTNTFSTSSGGMLWGTGVWGTGIWGGTGGGVVRRDLTGRGRVVRFKLANALQDETFRIDGLGALAQLDTNV